MRQRLLENNQTSDRCYFISWQEREANQIVQLQHFDARFRTLFCTMQWEDPHSWEVVTDIGPPFGPDREFNNQFTQESIENPGGTGVAATRPIPPEGVSPGMQLSPTQPQMEGSLVWS